MIAVAWSTPPELETAFTRTLRRAISIDVIKDRICEKYGVTRLELEGKQRCKRLTWPRHEAFYRASKETKASLPEIGRAFGGRDHTTVMHGIKAHARRINGAT